MRCSRCGTDNAANSRFCNQCATPLGLACPKCARVNAPDAKFCADCAQPLTSHTSKSNARASSAPSLRIAPEQTDLQVADGERKTVTALFADIKGSMDLLEGIDPEEARAIVDPALNLMIDAAHRYGGYIVQSTGDGIFALFGAPIAHEDHPQRAIFAALRMQEDVKRYAEKLRAEKGVTLQVRVGVNTGEVVVRSIRTDEVHTEYTPIGHSTGLASRLQALAAPGSIAVSETVRKLVEGYFALSPLGPTKIKGVSEPVNVYEVTGLGPLRTRLQRSAGRGLSKFVGREREIEALKQAADNTKAGRGQIVAATAEAGAGKSRLLFEFRAACAADWMVLEAFPLSHGKLSSYLPVIDLLHGYFRISQQDDQRARREKVAGRIAVLDRTLEDTLPYMHALLGIAEDPDPLAGMDARVRKRGTLDAIKRILLRESLNQPLMVIFEDLHWVDLETQALLNLLVDSIASAKVLLLVNYRPEYSHQWGSKSYYTHLRLDPLGIESADEMLTALLGNSAGLAALKKLITEKTEGNPLFMEETVGELLDDGALVREGARVRLIKALDDLKIPPTVRAILAARIDRLPAVEKDLLQTLAVIGKEFPQSLVRAVVPDSADEVGRMLDDLQFEEFIYEQPAVGDLEYTFKHALTQEVAYNSVLSDRRKLLHERIGAAIALLFKDSLDDHLSLLADHYARSSNVEKAIEYQAKAARRELAQGGYQGALQRLESAIDLFARLQESKRRAELELDLQIDYAAALLVTRGWWVPEAGKAYQRARELCQGKDQDPRLYRVLSGLHAFHLVRGEHPIAVSYAEEMIQMAERLKDDQMLAPAHLLSGFSRFFMGELLGAHAALERCIASAPAQGSPAAAVGPTDQDAPMSAMCYDATTLWILGFPDQAASRAAASLERARHLHSPFTMMWCLSQLTMYHTIRRDSEAAKKTMIEGLALAERHGFEFLKAQTVAYVTIGNAAEGKLDQVAEVSNESGYYDSSYELAQTWGRPLVALGFAGRGQIDIALALVAQAAELVEKNQERYVEAEVHRIKGELTLVHAKGPTRTSEETRAAESAAEQSFRHAIEIARRQKAKSWELRATTSLARLLRDTNRRIEARTSLGGIYNWFTEGFDTADLQDAKSLLDQLSG